MKILQVNKFFFLRAGAERYFLELTKLLEGAGHEVIPFAMQHPRKNLPTTYSRFFCFRGAFRPGGRARERHKKNRPDDVFL